MVDETPQHRKPVTIYDVAREAGVAASTVSRTFSRPGRVTAATNERVHRAAAKLGYRAKPIFRPEKGVATKMLAFVVADIANPVYSHIMKGFQEEATQNGYTVLLIDSTEDGQAEHQAIQSVLHLVDGLALTASRLSDSAINQVVKITPVVAVNRIIAGLPSVVPDTPRGMRRAVEHLATLGHTRLTYLSGPAASWADGVRWRAVSEACFELNLHARRVGPNVPSIQGGFDAAAAWREHPTSAVMAFNDIMAIGFMKSVQRSGLRVPDDVSVIGVDNSISSVLTTPTLTTVASSTSLIGARAARALIGQLQRRSADTAEIIVAPMDLIARESSGPRSENFPPQPSKGDTDVPRSP
ncbi:MAG: LacI family DNA-binding transcriptional regulator [Propionibacteriaceae bacterium]|nr:LacI family DNA-binding transcriptional regulator [Propionibacteriaceae bacterium]